MFRLFPPGFTVLFDRIMFERRIKLENFHGENDRKHMLRLPRKEIHKIGTVFVFYNCYALVVSFANWPANKRSFRLLTVNQKGLK